MAKIGGGLLALAGAAGTAGGLAAWNKMLEKGGGPAGRPGGEQRLYRSEGGVVSYSVAGEGHPLVMLHGIYAGASSNEWRKNFDALSQDFRVYAPDLLGCGLSEKPKRRYAPEDVAAQIEGFLREEVGGPAHLVASSLSATLVLPVLVKNPRLVKKLVLVCPTGYGSLDRSSGRLGDAVYGLFAAPLIGETLYHALVSRAGLRYYLRGMAYHDPSLVTDQLIEAYRRTSHGENARFLPASFVSGKLNLSAAPYWPRVPHKSLVCWGQEARTTPPSQLKAWINHNPRAEPRLFRDAALLPHDERAGTFNEEVRAFLLAGSRTTSRA